MMLAREPLSLHAAKFHEQTATMMTPWARPAWSSGVTDSRKSRGFLLQSKMRGNSGFFRTTFRRPPAGIAVKVALQQRRGEHVMS
jgi:hypothetical protein